MRGVVAAVTGSAVLLAFAPAAGSHPGHAPLEIDIANQSFTPKDVVVYQGDSVVFAWKGPDTNHSATGDGFDTDAGKPAAAIVHPVGDTYAVSFSKIGTFTYHCKVHPSMTGSIRVDPIPGAPPPQAPVLTRLTVKPRVFSRRTTVHFNLDSPSSMRATLRSGRKVIKEVDFNAHPGANSKKLDFGKKIRSGKFVLKLVAIDPSSGLSSKTASVKVQVKR